MADRSRTIHLRLIHGPDSRIVVSTMTNSPAFVGSAPWDRAHDLIDLEEMQGARLYILCGNDQTEGETTLKLYVGQGETDVRFGSHRRDKRKAFTDHVTILGSRDPTLREDHWLVIERELILLAKRSGLTVVVNDRESRIERFSPQVVSEARELLDDFRVLLCPLEPRLTVAFARTALPMEVSLPAEVAQPRPGPPQEATPVWPVLEMRWGVARVRARDEGDRVVMLKDSLVRNELRSSATQKVKALFEKARREGWLENTRDRRVLRLSRDLAFPNRTFAAEFAAGGNVNPRHLAPVKPA